MNTLDIENHMVSSDEGDYYDEPIPERDPDREYDSLRQQDDDLISVLSDIASIRLTDFFAKQAN